MKKNLFVVCIMCIVTLSVHAQLIELHSGTTITNSSVEIDGYD